METLLQEMCAAAGIGPAILTDLDALKPPGSPTSWRAEEFISGRTLDRENMRLARNLRSVGTALRVLHGLSTSEAPGEAPPSTQISAWSRTAALGDDADALFATDPRSAVSSQRVALPAPGRLVEGAGSWRAVADSVVARVQASLRSLGPQAAEECISHCDANPGNVIVLSPAHAAPPRAGPRAATSLPAAAAAPHPGSVAPRCSGGASSSVPVTDLAPAIQLIDFEYAAWAPRALDLANVLAEAEFDNFAPTLEGVGPGLGFAHDPRWALPKDLAVELLSGYGGRALAAQLWEEVEALLPLVHLSWGLWGVMMAARSGQSIDEEGAAVNCDGGHSLWSYWHYAAVRLEQAALKGAFGAAATAGASGTG